MGELVYHRVLVRVPVSFVQKSGSYHFVIRAWDKHAHLHKDHQVKPALEMNQRAQQLPPIVYIHHENWHVAWCLPGRGVQFATVRADPAEYCVVRDFTDATPLSQVRAAINGGFFHPVYVRGGNDPKTNNRVQMIAEVGTGRVGQWNYGIGVRYNSRHRRYCFGLDASGNVINFSLMERREEIHPRLGRIPVWRVARSIESGFPFGLSNVGLLVQNGRAVRYSPHWPHPNRNRGRTALAWMRDRAGGQHVFFVTIPDIPNSDEDATWDETADFIINRLPQILYQNYRFTINRSTIHAVMLDGGGSTKFGYRLNPRNSLTYQGFHRQHDATAPNSQRYLTTYITAQATFQE